MTGAYVLRLGRYIKVGYSIDVALRVRNYGCRLGKRELLAVVPCGKNYGRAYRMEGALLKKLRPFRCKGLEWHRVSPESRSAAIDAAVRLGGVPVNLTVGSRYMRGGVLAGHLATLESAHLLKQETA